MQSQWFFRAYRLATDSFRRAVASLGALRASLLK
jgi:hypothetical protein